MRELKSDMRIMVAKAEGAGTVIAIGCRAKRDPSASWFDPPV